jgi:uncharacterized membrane protein YgcG
MQKNSSVTMKEKNNFWMWMFLVFGTLAIQAPVQAQDDLYYNPATDATTSPRYNAPRNEQPVQQSGVTRTYREDGYADENGYEYSSRIRRFHRPVQTVDYYDPVFVDQYYYDPTYMPGATIYTYGYNDYWTWRRWQRWQRWNTFSGGYYDYGWGCNSASFSPWGWGTPYYSPWSNPYVFNSYYYDPYWTWNGYNPYYGGYGYNSYGYHSGYYGGYGSSDNGGGYKPKTYTGPRRGGTTYNSGYARIANGTHSGRLTTAATPSTPVIAMRNTAGARTNVTAKQPVDANPTAARIPNATTDRARMNPATAGRQTESAPARAQNGDRPRYEQPARTSQGSEYNSGASRGNTDARPARRADSAPARSEYRPSHSNESSRSFESHSNSGSSHNSGGSSSHSSGSSSGSHSSGSSSGSSHGRH